MKYIPTKLIQTVAGSVMFFVLATSIVGFAQDQPGDQQPSSAPTPGWRRFSNPPPMAAPDQPAAPQQLAQPQQPAPPLPARLTLQPGTFITVRIDQYLSSDKSRVDDGFSATLTRPLVVDGIVVAHQGEIVGGRVAEVQKAGRVKGVSRLGIRLTDLTLADGQQVPIQTELTGLTGPTSKGRDASAIAGTTVMGAAIGAAADWGPGAAIGGGAGLLAGTVGVLLTRGRPTVIYPESMLTFRLATPVAISTERAPQAFIYAGSNSYNRTAEERPSPAGRPCTGYGCPPPRSPYFYPAYGYPYPYSYPYWWGPSISLWYGPGFYRGWGRWR
jgi:hypothetical protein